MSRTKHKPPKKPAVKKSDPNRSAREKAKAKTRKRRTDFQKGFYLDHERFAALALEQTEGVTRASQQTGIPERTIRAWKDGFRTHQAADLYRLKAGDLARCFEAVAWECLAMAGERLGEAKFNHLMSGAGIAVEKNRLLRGEPTGINENRNKNLKMNEFLASLTPEQLELFLTAGEHAGRSAVQVGGAIGTRQESENESLALRAVVLADPEPGA